jgi:hypothetical protein
MPSLTSLPAVPQAQYFGEPLDELALLKSWCEEVEPRNEEPPTLPERDAVSEAHEFLNTDWDYITIDDKDMQWGEPMEIGEINVIDLGSNKKKAKGESYDSLRGHDTTNPSIYVNTLNTSTIDTWSTADTFAPQITQHGRARSDPCVPEIRTDRAASRQEGRTTTFMLRNIPNRVKVEDIQDRISSLGFGDTFDFLYMPLDLQSKQNKGYAFINLVNESVAADFAERFNGTRFEGRLSTKEVLVCKATAQGVLPTLRTIKHSNWSKKEHMPIVRVEGKLMHLTPLAACEILRIKAQYG